MSQCLVIAEHDNNTLNMNLANVVAAASQLSQEITVLVIGYQCQAVAEQATQFAKVNKVLLADNEAYTHQLAENSAKLIQTIAADYQHILLPASTFGKNLSPCIAALLDVAQISDISGIESVDTFIRPIYAGNAVATVTSHEPVHVLTVRTTAFDGVGPNGGKAALESVDTVCGNEKTKFVKQELQQSERPELTAARIVVSGGRGLQSAEQFKLIEQLADKLGAAVGASRAAVDAGFVANDCQVGQTGKIVAPELYIAIGISGAIQHIAGMNDSKIIVAINKDPDAAIFQIANYGVVGDLFKLVPELIEKL